MVSHATYLAMETVDKLVEEARKARQFAWKEVIWVFCWVIIQLYKHNYLRHDVINSKYELLLTLDTDSEVDYIVEKRGANSCKQGSTILDTSECEIACDQLNLKRGNLRDGKPCYMAGNGKCRQNTRLGQKASLICKIAGY